MSARDHPSDLRHFAAPAVRRGGPAALRATEAMAAGWREGIEGDTSPVRPREIERLVRRAERDEAVERAGLFESVYLAYCRMSES